MNDDRKPAIIVTGASRGLGEAIARLAAQRGYAVCVNYAHDAARAEGVVAAILAEGGTALAMQADVADEAAVARMFDRVEAELGPLRALVNNAGIAGPHARVEALTLDNIRRMFETNVFGAFLCAREAIKRMSTSHGGRGGAIVNLSSAAARLGGPGRNVHYSASKGAINSMTLGMGRELAAEGIRVNAVSPGIIDTESQPPGRVAEVGPTVPIGRAGQPDEVAKTVMWLVSDEASYVVGTVVDVSGGR